MFYTTFNIWLSMDHDFRTDVKNIEVNPLPFEDAKSFVTPSIGQMTVQPQSQSVINQIVITATENKTIF